MDNLKKLDIKDFRDLGILQEVNRLFFHPRGLALYVNLNDKTEEVVLGGILDYRGDPEGVIYEDGDIKEEFKLYTKRLLDMKKQSRIDMMGTQIQIK